MAYLDEHNVIKCLHATCGARSWSPVDLVVKIALGLDTVKGTKGVVAQVVQWFSRSMGISVFSTKAPATASTGKAAVARVLAPSNDNATIVISLDEQAVNDEAINALAKSADLYQRALRLTKVVQTPDTEPAIVELPEPTLRELMATHANWAQPSKDGLTPCHPPSWSVKAVHSRMTWDGIRHLAGVTRRRSSAPTAR